MYESWLHISGRLPSVFFGISWFSSLFVNSGSSLLVTTNDLVKFWTCSSWCCHGVSQKGNTIAAPPGVSPLAGNLFILFQFVSHGMCYCTWWETPGTCNWISSGLVFSWGLGDSHRLTITLSTARSLPGINNIPWTCREGLIPTIIGSDTKLVFRLTTWRGTLTTPSSTLCNKAFLPVYELSFKGKTPSNNNNWLNLLVHEWIELELLHQPMTLGPEIWKVHSQYC